MAPRARFGIRLETYEPLNKSWGAVQSGLGLALTITESLHPGALRDLVQYLHRNLHIPRSEILALRLDEREAIDAALSEKPARK